MQYPPPESNQLYITNRLILRHINSDNNNAIKALDKEKKLLYFTCFFSLLDFLWGGGGGGGEMSMNNTVGF